MSRRTMDEFLRGLPEDAYDRRIMKRRWESNWSITKLGSITKLYKHFEYIEKYCFFNTDAICPGYYREEDRARWAQIVSSGARSSWVTQEVQAAWELALQVPPGWLYDKTLPTPAFIWPDDNHPFAPNYRNPTAPKINIVAKTVAEELFVICAFIAQNRTASKKTLDPGQLTERELRLARVLALRYGVDITGDHQELINPKRKTKHKTIAQAFGFSEDRSSQILATLILRASHYKDRFDVPLTKLHILNPAHITNESDAELQAPLGPINYSSAVNFCKEVLLIEFAQ